MYYNYRLTAVYCHVWFDIVLIDLNSTRLAACESSWLDVDSVLEPVTFVFCMSYLECDCRGAEDPQQVFSEHPQVLMEIEDWWTNNKNRYICRDKNNLSLYFLIEGRWVFFWEINAAGVPYVVFRYTAWNGHTHRRKLCSEWLKEQPGCGLQQSSTELKYSEQQWNITRSVV